MEKTQSFRLEAMDKLWSNRHIFFYSGVLPLLYRKYFDNKVSRTLALHVANLDLIPDTAHSSPSQSTRSNPRIKSHE